MLDTLKNLSEEYEIAKESYDLLERLWILMGVYHPEINGKEVPDDLQNRMRHLFCFDDSE